MIYRLLQFVVDASQWTWLVNHYFKQFMMLGMGLIGLLFLGWSLQGDVQLSRQVYGSAAAIPAAFWGAWAFFAAVVYFAGWLRGNHFITTAGIGFKLAYMVALCWFSLDAGAGFPIAPWTFFFSLLIFTWFWGSLGVCAEIALKRVLKA